MKKTINIDTITRVTLIPIAESSWKIIPAYEYIPSIFEDVVWFITRKPVRVSETVWTEYWYCLYTLEEFTEHETTRFINNWKVYDMCQVYVEYISGNSTTRHFRDTEKAKDFYSYIIMGINNKYCYDEETPNIQ